MRKRTDHDRRQRLRMDGRRGTLNDVFDRVSKQLTSRRNFLGNTAKVGGGALALSTARGWDGTEDDSSDESTGDGKHMMTGLTTKTNGKKPGTGGFEKFGDRAFVVKENPEGSIPSHVKVACEGEERTRYHVYQIFYEGDVTEGRTGVISPG